MFQGDKVERRRRWMTHRNPKKTQLHGTCPNKVNIALGPKRALKALQKGKQAWGDESQPSAPIEGADLRSRCAICKCRSYHWITEHRAY
jgi:hypothetical protein